MFVEFGLTFLLCSCTRICCCCLRKSSLISANDDRVFCMCHEKKRAHCDIVKWNFHVKTKNRFSSHQQRNCYLMDEKHEIEAFTDGRQEATNCRNFINFISSKWRIVIGKEAYLSPERCDGDDDEIQSSDSRLCQSSKRNYGGKCN